MNLNLKECINQEYELTKKIQFERKSKYTDAGCCGLSILAQNRRLSFINGLILPAHRGAMRSTTKHSAKRTVCMLE